MTDLLGVLLTLVLLGCNAFFVATEFSLISSRRDRLESLVAQGRTRARTVMKASEDLSLMMAACQLGITICSILLGKVGEPAIGHLLEPVLHLVHAPDALLHPISFVVALALVVFLHVLAGEMVPKNIAIAGPETVAMVLVPVHLVFCAAAKPLIWVCNVSANGLLRLMGVQPKDELETSVTSAELTAMLAESRSSGLLDEEEHLRLTRALKNEDKTTTEVMIPVPQVTAVRATRVGIPVERLRAAVVRTGFSRYPVVDTAGRIRGYVHVKDLLEDLTATRSRTAVVPVSAVRPMPAVQADVPVDDALAVLRQTSSHMARVTDADGATIGVVSLEDLLEEFVGTVRDGTNRPQPPRR